MHVHYTYIKYIFVTIETGSSFILPCYSWGSFYFNITFLQSGQFLVSYYLFTVETSSGFAFSLQLRQVLFLYYLVTVGAGSSFILPFYSWDKFWFRIFVTVETGSSFILPCYSWGRFWFCIFVTVETSSSFLLPFHSWGRFWFRIFVTVETGSSFILPFYSWAVSSFILPCYRWCRFNSFTLLILQLGQVLVSYYLTTVRTGSSFTKLSCIPLRAIAMQSITKSNLIGAVFFTSRVGIIFLKIFKIHETDFFVLLTREIQFLITNL